jgi:hypothetical protein
VRHLFDPSTFPGAEEFGTRLLSRSHSMPSAVTSFILPGLGDSGPDHWQSHFERDDISCVRVKQDEWDTPDCADWVARLDREMRSSVYPVRLVAHSSSCTLVARWALDASPEELAKVCGALLVAPSDPDGPNYPSGPVGFSPVPLVVLPFPSIVVASDDDPYVSLERAREYAAAWGSELVVLSGAGHVNVASGFGAWPEGQALMQRLI